MSHSKRWLIVCPEYAWGMGGGEWVVGGSCSSGLVHCPVLMGVSKAWLALHHHWHWAAASRAQRCAEKDTSRHQLFVAAAYGTRPRPEDVSTDGSSAGEGGQQRQARWKARGETGLRGLS